MGRVAGAFLWSVLGLLRSLFSPIATGIAAMVMEPLELLSQVGPSRAALASTVAVAAEVGGAGELGMARGRKDEGRSGPGLMERGNRECDRGPGRAGAGPD